MADLARDADVAFNTAKSWLSILQASGIVYLLEPYHRRMIAVPNDGSTGLPQQMRGAVVFCGESDGAYSEVFCRSISAGRAAISARGSMVIFSWAG